MYDIVPIAIRAAPNSLVVNGSIVCHPNNVMNLIGINSNGNPNM